MLQTVQARMLKREFMSLQIPQVKNIVVSRVISPIALSSTKKQVS